MLDEASADCFGSEQQLIFLKTLGTYFFRCSRKSKIKHDELKIELTVDIVDTVPCHSHLLESLIKAATIKPILLIVVMKLIIVAILTNILRILFLFLKTFLKKRFPEMIFMSIAELIEAVKIGNSEKVRCLLIGPCIDPTYRDNYAVKTAARFGHVDAMKYLLYDARVNDIMDIKNYSEVLYISLTNSQVKLQSPINIIYVAEKPKNAVVYINPIRPDSVLVKKCFLKFKNFKTVGFFVFFNNDFCVFLLHPSQAYLQPHFLHLRCDP